MRFLPLGVSIRLCFAGIQLYFSFKRELYTKVKITPKIIYVDNARFVTVNFSSFFFNIEQEKKFTGSLQIQWVSLGELKVFLSAIFTSNHSRMLLATKHFSSIHLPLPCVVGFLCCCFCVLFLFSPRTT